MLVALAGGHRKAVEAFKRVHMTDKTLFVHSNKWIQAPLQAPLLNSDIAPDAILNQLQLVALVLGLFQLQRCFNLLYWYILKQRRELSSVCVQCVESCMYSEGHFPWKTKLPPAYIQV